MSLVGMSTRLGFVHRRKDGATIYAWSTQGSAAAKAAAHLMGGTVGICVVAEGKKGQQRLDFNMQTGLEILDPPT